MKTTLSTFIIALLCFFSQAINASEVDVLTAQKAAQAFYQIRTSSRIATVKRTTNVSSHFVVKNNGANMYYVFNFDCGGFVLISANDALYPILGYAYEGEFLPENQPIQVKEWMGTYERQAQMANENKVLASEKSQKAWGRLTDPLNKSDFFDKGDRAVEPLTQYILWNQDNLYNELCPVDTAGPGDHVYAGCVATSAAIIMYYWRYPNQGTSSHSYNASGYGTQSANFGTTTYGWDGMTPELNGNSAENHQVAKLQYHLGVAVDMGYSADGSGSQTSKMENVFKNYFKYATDVNWLEKDGGWGSSGYTDDEWKQILRDNLDLGRPMQYSGFPPEGGSGHAFVCDGYEGTDHFHFNFGWSGYYNAYFYIDNLLLSNGYNFTSGQGAMVNIHPNVAYAGCSGAKTLTDAFGTIEDGSGPVGDYANNGSCTWLIAPTNVDKITLTFVKLATESANDLITIYDGADENAAVLGTYSGSTIPASVTSTGDKVFVKFTTNSSVTDNGWLLKYSSTFPVYCGGSQVYTASSGTFGDGSGVNSYNNGSNCTWSITPQGASSVTVSFSEFSTESDFDFVKVYSLAPMKLLASYSGSAIPSGSVTSTTGSMRVIFTSSQTNRGGGFIANYTSTATSIEENNVVAAFEVYPNPTENYASVRFVLKDLQDVKLEVVNIHGEVIKTDYILKGSNSVAHLLDLSKQAKGIYLVRITGDRGSFTKRLILQ